MKQPGLRGVNDASDGIEITCQVNHSVVVYIQPKGHGDNIISFEDFRSVVGKYDDLLSRRFAQSLAEWGCVTAGERELSGSGR